MTMTLVEMNRQAKEVEKIIAEKSEIKDSKVEAPVKPAPAKKKTVTKGK